VASLANLTSRMLKNKSLHPAIFHHPYTASYHLALFGKNPGGD
jgi:hypothetical protein